MISVRAWVLLSLFVALTLPFSSVLAQTATSDNTTAPEVSVPWTVICELENQVADDPADRCRIAQSLVTAETAQPVLLVRVYADPDPLVLVTVPLDIFLKPGLAMQVDDGRIQKFGFEICNAEGCHTGIPLTTDILAAFKRGLIARFTYLDATGSEITLPVDLRGFTKSWEDMTDAQNR